MFSDTHFVLFLYTQACRVFVYTCSVEVALRYNYFAACPFCRDPEHGRLFT